LGIAEPGRLAFQQMICRGKIGSESVRGEAMTRRLAEKLGHVSRRCLGGAGGRGDKRSALRHPKANGEEVKIPTLSRKERETRMGQPGDDLFLSSLNRAERASRRKSVLTHTLKALRHPKATTLVMLPKSGASRPRDSRRVAGATVKGDVRPQELESNCFSVKTRR
jgi:hypothetical protein